MKTGRKRVKNPTKGRKKWKKGHSSSSNPEAKKHREAAKSRFFNVNTGPSGLTVEALAKHDAGDIADGDAHMSDAGTATQSVDAKTFNTWATNWTDCTNATFGRVHRYWTSNSVMHKEILAVLAAITEVIKERGGKETETEYFAALMTSLDTVEAEESLAAVAYLLGLVIKRVPVPVLRSKFSVTAKTLLDILGSHVSTSTPALLRSVIMCLAQLLRVQDQATWGSSSTLHVYNGLLSFTDHPKPKVRKAAHQAVKVILRGSLFMTQSTDSPSHHPAASATAKYCIQQIEQCGGTGEATTTLHILGLLKDILGIFPQQGLKSCCETVLRVMTLSNVMVRSVSMQALHGMFVMKPKATSLPPELNAQILTALYDYQPGENDVQPTGAWMTVMEQACINLFHLKEDLCLSHLPRFFNCCMKSMLSEQTEVTKAAAKTLTTLLRECVAPAAERLKVEVDSAPKGSVTPVHKLFRAVEGGLSYQYHAAWGLVLHVITVFIEILGAQCHPIMKKCLASMADLRDSHEFPYKTELDKAIGMAVKKMGPRVLLDAVPLHITGEEDNYEFPRSWLLPVIRDNLSDTELAFFNTYFLPLAAKLRTRSIHFAKENRVVESKTYDALQMQIWSMLPGFCTWPTDIKESFKGIAKILGSALNDRPDLRMDVMSSLRKVIAHSQQNEEDRAEVARFAKNFLPILFNLVTTEPESGRNSTQLAVLETIKCYLQLTDKQLTNTFFTKCYSKLGEEDISAHKRHALMDLAIIMVPHVDSGNLQAMYPSIIAQLQSTDRTIQKKCYRMLEELCAGKSPACKDFVTSSLLNLENHLLKSLSSSAPSSKAPRLRCLVHIFRQLDTSQLNFVQAVAPEAILCTKEVAEKARGAAYLLLTEMGKALLRWMPDLPKKDVVSQYMEVLLSGLAGSAHMVACTVLALTHVLYQFKDDVNNVVLRVLIENTCLLLRSKAREIVQSALALLKVILSSFPDTTLAQFLQDIISSLVSMKEDNRHHFRFKAKEIYAKLIRKFGYQIIFNMVPESHHKILINIRKTQQRAKRKAKSVEEEEEQEDAEGAGVFPAKHKPENIDDLLRDTDSELEEDSADKQRPIKKAVRRRADKKSGSTWLKEGGEDDIVDFLDPSVVTKVLATKPQQQSEKRPGVKHDFKMAADGRLIIQADSSEQDKTGKMQEDIDDLGDLLEAMGGPSKKAKKRKLTEGTAEEEGDFAYKAGGSGIHRPLGKKLKASKESQEPGLEYKAKKAGGDIKKRGKPDPFAYLPLQFQYLNRRKKAKAAGQFRNLVKGAKKGAARGSKQKLKHKAK